MGSQTGRRKKLKKMIPGWEVGLGGGDWEVTLGRWGSEVTMGGGTGRWDWDPGVAGGRMSRTNIKKKQKYEKIFK